MMKHYKLSLKIKNEVNMPAVTSIKHHSASITSIMREEKSVRIGKEEIKL